MESQQSDTLSRRLSKQQSDIKKGLSLFPTKSGYFISLFSSGDRECWLPLHSYPVLPSNDSVLPAWSIAAEFPRHCYQRIHSPFLQINATICRQWSRELEEAARQTHIPWSSCLPDIYRGSPFYRYMSEPAIPSCAHRIFFSAYSHFIVIAEHNRKEKITSLPIVEFSIFIFRLLFVGLRNIVSLLLIIFDRLLFLLW